MTGIVAVPALALLPWRVRPIALRQAHESAASARN
jgi:hypothetical protein